jgi:ferredoxin-NADP reductase
MNSERITYQVCETNIETESVKTLKLVMNNGLVPSYVPGQFITVFHPDSEVVEGKAYSISSAPHESTLNITVKSIGEFSSMLVSKMPGDTINATLPYGYFYSESKSTSLVMIAGGIGIVPFRSMIVQSVKKTPLRTMHLLYSARSLDDLIFKNEFDLQMAQGKLSTEFFVTRERVNNDKYQARRIRAQDVMDCSKYLEDPEFFLCGSIDFVKSLWKDMIHNGIAEDQIYTEGFY